MVQKQIHKLYFYIESSKKKKKFDGAGNSDAGGDDKLTFLWGLISYKNNIIRTRLKFAQKLRTSSEQLRLGFRCKCSCKFLLKNTAHHVITCGVSSKVLLHLETPSEQRRKSKLCRSPTCFTTVPNCIYGNSSKPLL